MHLFHVPALGCGGCLGFVVRALRDIDDAIRIESVLLRTLREAGYAADPVLQAWG